ncbi:MAG: LysM peptidoglycan-binding domain-containing protein, partial [Thermodesulfobacteriota bacterium]
TAPIVHTVKVKESLYSIAKMHGSSVDKIKAENNLKIIDLKPGQKLVIPSAEPKVSLTSENNSENVKKESVQIVHTVKKSESLYSIAKMHGSDVAEIKAKNNLNNNDLKPGQKLIIPPAGKKVYAVNADDNSIEPTVLLKSKVVSPKKANLTHTVKSGDTLGQIAVKYGLKSSRDIIAANSLNGSSLSIGQVLIIPAQQGTSAVNKYVELQSFPVAKTNSPKLTFETKNKESVESKPVTLTTKIKQEKIEQAKNNKQQEELITYKIKSGDTLGQIAVKFGLGSSREIIEFNNLKDTNLTIGQVINIPSTKSKSSEIAQNKPAQFKEDAIRITHTVKPSDTLFAIARMHGTSVDKIKTENRLIGNKLRIGQKLTIPPADKNIQVVKTAPKTEDAAKPVTKKKDFPGTYKVRSGDTLSQIAQNFKVRTTELKDANNLSSNKLRVGQKLSVPNTPAAITKSAKTTPKPRIKSYTVKKGDTLIGISKKHDTNVAALTNYNSLSSLNLKVGQKLQIPDKSFKYTKSGNINYRVKKGDTLSTIARNFKVSVSSIKYANGLRSSKIKIGTKLTIPTAKKNTTVVKHTVKRGETLSQIARKHGSSVSSIKRANNLRNSYIRPGQKLKIHSTVNRYVTTVRTPHKSKTDINLFNNEFEAKNELIKVAKQYLGAPYKFGGTSTRTGIDCSAYVNKVYGFFDVNLPRTARDIYKKGHWVSKGKLQKGDLVFFTTYAKFPSHVGIYIGNNNFIHASSASKRVTITNINKNYYKKRYIGAKRISIKSVFAKKTP